ncbi:MAG: ArsR family transcriptional regulator [Nitrospirota bacterium]|nr:MAG: ArsR family transcriptional regulator [Nitrospirota bacterium]
MSEVARISPQETREKALAGIALLVCAYDNDEKFRKMRLDGAISLSEFRQIEDTLSRDREIIFY